jgi:hypothetical protein
MTNARRTTAELASTAVLLAFGLGFSTTRAIAADPKSAPTNPPAAASAASDETMNVLLGDWAGTLVTGGEGAKLRLALHLGKNPDGVDRNFHRRNPTSGPSRAPRELPPTGIEQQSCPVSAPAEAPGTRVCGRAQERADAKRRRA